MYARRKMVRCFGVQGKVLHFPQTLHVVARKVMQMHSMRAITV